ncbi:MAG: TolC family protein [Desulfitobacterium sp.]|nr:TolC family protein [Desulfitobacterium sp.]
MKKYNKVLAIALVAFLVFTTNSILAVDNHSIDNQPADNKPVEDTLLVATTTSASAPDKEENEEESPAPSEDLSTLRLSLENALEMVETGNSTFRLTDDKIAIYERQYEQALAVHLANYSEVDEKSAKGRRLNHKRALWTLENAQYDREKQLKDLKVQVANQYQNILALQEQVKTFEKQIENVDTLIEQLNLQIDLGLGIESQVLALKAQKSSLEAGLAAAQNNIKSSMIALKRDLGININREVILTSDLLPYKKFDDSNLNKRIKEAIENDYDKKRYEEDIELTEIEYKIAFDYDNPAADQLQISIEDKKATLEALPITKEVALRTAYNNLKSMENSVEAAKLAVEADQINIELLQKKIDAGVSSSIEIIELQTKLLNDQYTLLQSINSYMTAVANFENSLDFVAADLQDSTK